jgi:hypothetical protein
VIPCLLSVSSSSSAAAVAPPPPTAAVVPPCMTSHGEKACQNGEIRSRVSQFNILEHTQPTLWRSPCRRSWSLLPSPSLSLSACPLPPSFPGCIRDKEGPCKGTQWDLVLQIPPRGRP